MYQLSQIIISITFCFFYLQVPAQHVDTTKICIGNNYISYFEFEDENHFPIRRLVFFNKDTSFYNDNILNCSVCGGKINESLDTVYFLKNLLIIKQGVDDFTDKIIFKKIKNNYKLVTISRLIYGNRNKIKIYKFKNKNILLSNMVYDDF